MKTLLLFVALAWAACPAFAESLRGGRCMLPNLGLAMGTVSALTATPGTISFSATNPLGGAVTGSSAATLSWLVANQNNNIWTLSVQALASSFTSCATVPVTAVTATCVAASVSGSKGSATCATSFTLSTVANQIANGTQANGNQTYTVQINYTLAESWRYVANSSCTLSLTYTVNAL